MLLLCLCLAAPAQRRSRKAKAVKNVNAERIINANQLQQIREAYAASPNAALQNALSHTGDFSPMAVSADKPVVDDHFKYEAKALPSSPDQVKSGRCWLFTSLNYCRQFARRKPPGQ